MPCTPTLQLLSRMYSCPRSCNVFKGACLLCRVQMLFHIMSAFNLNIEVVAPECLLPDVSYQAKFFATVALPFGVAFLFVVLACVQLVWHRCCRCRPLKGIVRETSVSLVASVVALTYFFYIYITRTLLEPFNCTPTGMSNQPNAQ